MLYSYPHSCISPTTMRVAPLPSVHRLSEPPQSHSSRWLGHQSSSVSVSDSDSDDNSSRVSYYSTLSRNSLSTAADSRRSAKSPTSAADPSAPQHGYFVQWLYRYPRTAFSLVLALSAIVTGAYSAYFFATLTLKLAGAPSAFALARTQLVATEITLARTTECGLKLLTPRIAAVKTHIEMETAPWKNAFLEYTAQRVLGRANLTVCEDRELATYYALLDDNATCTREQLDCLVEGIQRTLVQCEQTPSASVKRLMERLKVVARAVTMHMSRDDSKLTLYEMANKHRDTALLELDTWMSELRRSLDAELQAVAAKLAPPNLRGSTVGSAETRGEGGNEPDTKDRLVASLRKIAGKDRKKQRWVDDVETAWDDMALVTRQQEQRGEQYQEDLDQIQKATRARLQQSVDAIDSIVSDLRETIAGQTRSLVSTLASDLLQRVFSTLEELFGEPLSHKTAMELNGTHEIGESESQWEPKRADELTLHFGGLDGKLRELSELDEPTTIEYSSDTRIWRTSLLEASSMLVTIVLTYDFLKRVTWLFAKIASLMTESYTDLPPVDIRDISAITTLIDFWGVLKCRHDLGSVVYTLLTESSYVVQTAVHFVLWVLVEICGTTAFMAWRREFVGHCRPEPGQRPTESIEFNFLKVLELFLGELTKDGLTPLKSVQLRSMQLHNAFNETAADWQQQINTTGETYASDVAGLLLERQLLFDLRANLLSCQLPVKPSELDSEQCSLAALSQPRDFDTWVKTAPTPFESETIRHFFKPESILAECLHHNSDENAAVTTIDRLELARSCQLDQNLYMSLASWWMLFIVGLALRFISRMVVKSLSMVFWRFLRGDRLDVLAYCDESGVVQSPERLPRAVRRHLRNIRWRVSARLLGVALCIAWVILIACLVLSGDMMRPLA